MFSKMQMIVVAGVCLAAPLPALADVTYQETTTITGGSMLSMMKFAGALSKQARQATEPIVTMVIIQGDRMARVLKDSTEVIDLDKETITRIDNIHHQYSVITFDEMRKQIEDAMRQAESKQDQKSQADTANMKFDVKVRQTGATKDVNGMATSESILNLALEATDQKSGQTGAFAMTNDMWLTPSISGYDEVRDFYRRYAEKMGVMLSGVMNPRMLAQQPGMAKGMASMMEEMSKLKGVPVLQVMRMGSTTNGQPLPAASEAPLPASNDSPAPGAGDVAQQSAASAIASKLGGFGLGGFGRKKKTTDAAPANDQGNPSNNQQQAVAVLIETNTELNSFSTAPADVSRFAIPAGFQQVSWDKK